MRQKNSEPERTRRDMNQAATPGGRQADRQEGLPTHGMGCSGPCKVPWAGGPGPPGANIMMQASCVAGPPHSQQQ